MNSMARFLPTPKPDSLWGIWKDKAFPFIQQRLTAPSVSPSNNNATDDVNYRPRPDNGDADDTVPTTLRRRVVPPTRGGVERESHSSLPLASAKIAHRPGTASLLSSSDRESQRNNTVPVFRSDWDLNIRIVPTAYPSLAAATDSQPRESEVAGVITARLPAGLSVESFEGFVTLVDKSNGRRYLCATGQPLEHAKQSARVATLTTAPLPSTADTTTSDTSAQDLLSLYSLSPLVEDATTQASTPPIKDTMIHLPQDTQEEFGEDAMRLPGQTSDPTGNPNMAVSFTMTPPAPIVVIAERIRQNNAEDDKQPMDI